jgi:hypothetical protein
MEKKIITVTAPASIISAIGFVLVPVSTQKILAESIYLQTLRETIQICLS